VTAAEFAADVDEDGGRWRVATWQVPPWHTAAIAVRAAPGETVAVRFAEVRGPLRAGALRSRAHEPAFALATSAGGSVK
jgi:hypothetical protein